VTGTNETAFVYPNPGTDVLNVMLKNPESKTGLLTIQNVLGQEILSQTIYTSTHSITLDASGFASGPYFLSIIDTEGKSVVRWLKE
jgi:hypothetical protein